MPKKLFTFILVFALLNYSFGCTTLKQVKKEDLRESEHITEVISPTGEVFVFDKPGARLVRTGTQPMFVGTIDGKHTSINLDDVLYVKVKRIDPATTTLATLGVLALVFVGAVAIVAATKESCPFVYSYDGERYVFDAEPLGGAISRGLEKTDYSRLEHLTPVDGAYRVKIRNEVQEVQFLDEVKLVVVDHAPGTEIVPDLQGNFVQVENLITPQSAIDENGQSLMNFVKKQDELVWQTHLPNDESFHNEALRHQLTFEFPKPQNASRAILIVNAGTALWGSNMIREMLEMRGDNVDAWYAGIDNYGPELEELYNFIEREELYLLKIHVKEGETWRAQGFVPGSGPLIAETKATFLDLRNIEGDKLTIRLNPPKGFWTLDYLAVVYENDRYPDLTEIPLQEAIAHNGTNVTKLMLQKDGNYYVMPEVGDWANLSFNAPQPLKDKQRTVFLKSHGYYKIQFDTIQPEQTSLIQKMLATPEMIVSHSLTKYLKWRSEQLSKN